MCAARPHGFLPLCRNSDSFPSFQGHAVRLKVRQPGSGRYRLHLAGAATVPEEKQGIAMDNIEIKRAPDGSRYVRPYLGINPVTGRPIRPQHRIPDDVPDDKVMDHVKAWLMGRGSAAELDRTDKLGDLLDRHIDFLKSQGYPANTIRTYRRYRKYADPLCSRDVQEVDSAVLSRLYQTLIYNPKKPDSEKSVTTVIGLHHFMSSFFTHLVQLGVVQRNPADDAWIPRRQMHEAQALTPEQAKKLGHWLEDAMKTAKSGRIRREAMCIYLALNTGMRVGEVCGLRVRDWDSARQTIRVCGTVVEDSGHDPVRQPKTKGRKSRTVSLDDATARMVGSFYSADGSQWSMEDPLIPGPRGGWMRPTTASRAFRRLADRLGLPKTATFHTLRHTHATLLLMDGTDARTVSERLGHADVATTLRIYGHVLPGRDSEAAETFRRAVNGR